MEIKRQMGEEGGIVIFKHALDMTAFSGMGQEASNLSSCSSQPCRSTWWSICESYGGEAS